jgi:hypothetical protein
LAEDALVEIVGCVVLLGEIEPADSELELAGGELELADKPLQAATNSVAVATKIKRT